MLFAEESPAAEKAEPPKDLSKEKCIAILRHEQQSMKDIYEDEKYNLKEDLRLRLREIEDNQEGSEARREAVSQWKQDCRNLKAAYRQAWNENADEIAALEGKPARKHSSGAIEVYSAPPSVRKAQCSRKIGVRRSGCRRVRRCRRCR